jgi:hypothetical protein
MEICINEYVDWRLEVERLNIPDHPSSITLFIWADVFTNIFKLLSLTATMSGAVLLFGRFQNTGGAVGAAGKTEASVHYICIHTHTHTHTHTQFKVLYTTAA